MLCDQTGADIEAVRKGLGSDSRIGPDFLQAGAGFGGSCFPKDIRALNSMGKEHSLSTDLIQAIDTINMDQKKRFASKIIHYFENRGGMRGKKIAILGLAFKPNTDDMREASSITIIEELQKEGADIIAYDPIAMENAKKILRSNIFADTVFDAIKDVDAIVLVTEWAEFCTLDLSLTRSQMSGCAFFDGRNQFDPEKMAKLGFDYISVGRPPCYGSVDALDKMLEQPTAALK